MSKVMREIIYQKLIEKEMITFSEYMETVLYHQEAGYYSTKKNVFGKSGDFYTSAHAGTIFGEVFAEVFIKEVLISGLTSVLEYGAGEGKIAKAFLDYLNISHPDIYKQISFNIIEISPQLRDTQKKCLAEHIHKVKWIKHIKEISPFRGMIYCNEFLDALPVHIIKYGKENLKEMFLYYEKDKIANKYQDVSHDVNKYMSFLPKLPSGSITEFCIESIKWLEEIYKHSEQAVIYIIDYGYTFAQKNTQQRRSKTTIRCFKNHKVLSNPFAEMGERDITADVDFTTLQQIAEKIGFSSEYFISQSKFIMQSGLLEKLMAGQADFIAQTNLEGKLRNIKQLIFPAAMGDAFNALKLSKKPNIYSEN